MCWAAGQQGEGWKLHLWVVSLEKSSFTQTVPGPVRLAVQSHWPETHILIVIELPVGRLSL